ncbi:HK97 family phage prohead protease [Streptomyces cinnabarinus]|uniref:HK97 family phage prohead protease n=1 Tax=Streptomyces cinnabarinus TaxID=67287 RepID=A0ABY7K6M5_9ACTN|nr:HK97 family phage prohead protease [Streptomyces cinnabarinus]WAZ20174.1 HK97 family phage prohead protease [Streptomyces cinnabarinus]
MADRRDLIDVPERRAIQVNGGLELRADGTKLTLTGYASVFESPYDVYGGPPYGWTEIVDRKAFDVTLAAKPDLHLLINHAGMPLARTKSGTLLLAADTKGLHVEAELDADDPDVQRLLTKMKRGDMDEMSFGFRVKRQEWNEDYTERRLLEVSLHKGDVSVVNFGANPATSAEINSAAGALEILAALDPDAAMAELRSEGVDLERLTRARDAVVALHRQMRPRPKAPGRLSLAEARAIEGGDVAVKLSAQIPAHGTAVSNEPGFDRRSAAAGGAGNQVVLRYVHAWVDPDGDPESADSYRFPHHEPRIGSPANLGAVRHALSLLPQADMPPEAKAAVETHLRRHLEDAG